jgi:hypothetical protein
MANFPLQSMITTVDKCAGDLHKILEGLIETSYRDFRYLGSTSWHSKGTNVSCLCHLVTVGL